MTDPLAAKWIWRRGAERVPYNETIIARRRFRLTDASHGTLRITADSWYRVFVNGAWVNDGPARCWPQHWQVDVIDVTPWLRRGANEIRVVAQFFGAVTCQEIPQAAGLLAQLDVPGRRPIVTDGRWECALATQWPSNTANYTIQFEPQEYVDARLGEERFATAQVLHPAGEGPWRNLEPRDVRLLSREPRAFERVAHAARVKAGWLGFTIPFYRLRHKGFIQGSKTTCNAAAVATHVMSDRARTVHIEGTVRVRLNGRLLRGPRAKLAAGENLLIATPARVVAYEKSEPGLRIVETEGIALRNPVDPAHENPFCFIPLETGEPLEDGRFRMPTGDILERAEWLDALDRVCARVDAADLERALCLPGAQMLADDSYAQFAAREVLGPADAVEQPAALLHDTAEATVIRPPDAGDVELLLDLGEQTVGIWQFDLTAPAGVKVDLYAVEHIAPDGRVQHTRMRNGFRTVTAEGRNRITSLKRRGGRYLFVTLRNLSAPVRVRNVRVIESTYPINAAGRFRCSDPVLADIWRISARALALCMEDTFTDCPLYEQVCWVGDMRNEALFAYTAFGAHDLAARCLRLAARSLDTTPMVRCQVPSSRGGIIPAWALQWGLAVWEYYEATGDAGVLREMWPFVERNLAYVAAHRDARGLFSAPHWNMFDWAAIDDKHATVLHNSLFAVGAVDAALKCAKVLGRRQGVARLRTLRRELAQAVRNAWDADRRAFPDAFDEDGNPSPSVSQHTSFLALLYDVADEAIGPHAARNTLDPPEGMTSVGSPFAMQFRYEAMEKLGERDAIVASIRRRYRPMLDAGASTVWETFPHTRPAVHDAFPTRSHCHGWSAAPVHFLNRIVLGIRPAKPGARTVEISPQLSGLDWAEGASATPHGPVRVRWGRTGDRLNITAEAPDGVRLRFKANPSMAGLDVRYNGRRKDVSP